MVKLKQRVPEFTQYVQTICIPWTNETYEGWVATVAGWGKTETGIQSDVLMQTKLTVLANHECGNLYPIGMLCGKPHKLSSTCRGDSGGPFMLHIGHSRWTLIGVYSWRFGACESVETVGATRVSEYIDWIKHTVNN